MGGGGGVGVGGGLLACAGQVVGGERCNAGCLFSGGQFLRLRPPPFFFSCSAKK